MITPEMVAIAKTSARKPTAMQNSRSLRHHPAMRSVATTDVVHPLTMPTTHAATAGRELCSVDGTLVRRARAVASKGPGPRGMWLVSGMDIAGIGPLGARRMIRVRASVGPEGSEGGALSGSGSGEFSLGGGSVGSVTGQPA